MWIEKHSIAISPSSHHRLHLNQSALFLHVCHAIVSAHKNIDIFVYIYIYARNDNNSTSSILFISPFIHLHEMSMACTVFVRAYFYSIVVFAPSMPTNGRPAGATYVYLCVWIDTENNRKKLRRPNVRVFALIIRWMRHTNSCLNNNNMAYIALSVWVCPLYYYLHVFMPIFLAITPYWNVLCSTYCLYGQM